MAKESSSGRAVDASITVWMPTIAAGSVSGFVRSPLTVVAPRCRAG